MLRYDDGRRAYAGNVPVGMEIMQMQNGNRNALGKNIRGQRSLQPGNNIWRKLKVDTNIVDTR